MSYFCGKCGLGVIVLKDHEPIKACDCNAPIHMNIEATLEGKGGVSV